VNWISIALLLLVALLVRENYRLERRWRGLRYCWQNMSDFAEHRLRVEGCRDPQWESVLREQLAFLGRFGVGSMTEAQLQVYEEALIERQIHPLEQYSFSPPA